MQLQNRAVQNVKKKTVRKRTDFGLGWKRVREGTEKGVSINRADWQESREGG